MEEFISQPWVRATFGLIILLAAAWLVHIILRRYVTRAVTALLRRTVPRIGESEATRVFARRLLALPPYAVVYNGIAFVPDLDPVIAGFVRHLALALGIILAARAVAALLDVGHAMYLNHPASGGRPIKGYVQVVKLVLYIIATIVAVAALANKSPLIFLSGLGAMTAVLLLIFKDTLLSLVAGVQLTNNDLLRVGDWIEMPQFQADGTVIDISLNVVRVQNWDRTITAIPAHHFLEYSFRNWRGMTESGGRRICRTIYIDMNTIRFLTADEIERYRGYLLVKDYIEARERELAEWNAANCPPEGSSVRANLRLLTNVGLFRAYVAAYLARHPQIHNKEMILVRQMEPGPNGVGIQIYAFSRDTRWVYYEAIQGDVVEHCMAMAPEFGLRIFQAPSGHDVVNLDAPSAARLGSQPAPSPVRGNDPG
jgi:miniconductance mechanosensitive channel